MSPMTGFARLYRAMHRVVAAAVTTSSLVLNSSWPFSSTVVRRHAKARCSKLVHPLPRREVHRGTAATPDHLAAGRSPSARACGICSKDPTRRRLSCCTRSRKVAVEQVAVDTIPDGDDGPAAERSSLTARQELTCEDVIHSLQKVRRRHRNFVDYDDVDGNQGGPQRVGRVAGRIVRRTHQRERGRKQQCVLNLETAVCYVCYVWVWYDLSRISKQMCLNRCDSIFEMSLA